MKPRMVVPGAKELDALGGDLLALEHHLESPLAEELFERGEVDVLGCGVELALGVEDPERGDRMEVGMEIEERAERLGEITIAGTAPRSAGKCC